MEEVKRREGEKWKDQAISKALSRSVSRAHSVMLNNTAQHIWQYAKCARDHLF